MLTPLPSIFRGQRIQIHTPRSAFRIQPLVCIHLTIQSYRAAQYTSPVRQTTSARGLDIRSTTHPSPYMSLRCFCMDGEKHFFRISSGPFRHDACSVSAVLLKATSYTAGSGSVSLSRHTSLKLSARSYSSKSHFLHHCQPPLCHITWTLTPARGERERTPSVCTDGKEINANCLAHNKPE